MTTRTRSLLNLAAALFIGGLVAYTIHLLNQVTEDMIQDRIAHANFFSKLIKENWDGIKSFSDEEKKALLNSLNPTFLSMDIRMLRLVILILLCGFAVSIILGRLVVIFKLWQASSARNSAPYRQAGIV
jgi:hypothetical protein